MMGFLEDYEKELDERIDRFSSLLKANLYQMWRPYDEPFDTPARSGDYLVTIEDSDGERRIEVLHWYGDAWMNDCTPSKRVRVVAYMDTADPWKGEER